MLNGAGEEVSDVFSTFLSCLFEFLFWFQTLVRVLEKLLFLLVQRLQRSKVNPVCV